MGTVDRVLHNRGRVHPDTRARVRRILKELNYRTNIFAKHLKMGRVFTFGVLMPRLQQDSYYWLLPYRGIEKAKEELTSHRVRARFFFFDRFNEKSALTTGQRLLRIKPDGLLAAPVLPGSFLQLCQSLPSDLPLVFFDSYIPELKPLTFIGQDAFQSGLLASRLMKQTIHRKKGLVAIVKILPEDYHIIKRMEGFLRGSRDCSGLRTEVLELGGGWTAAETRALLESFYQKHRDLAGIFVTNAMTHKVAEWWKGNSARNKIILIGYDPIPKNIKLLKEGAIDFLLSQQSERQGYEGLYALFRKVVLGEEVKSRIMTQIDIITADNVDYYRS